jgi:hypothetical protein
MDRRDSNGFFSTQRVCMARDRSNKTTGLSLVVAHRLDKHLGFLCKLLKRHSSAHVRAHSCGYYNIIDNILL